MEFEKVRAAIRKNPFAKPLVVAGFAGLLSVILYLLAIFALGPGLVTVDDLLEAYKSWQDGNTSETQLRSVVFQMLERSHSGRVVYGLILDIATALAGACILILAVEIHSSNRIRAEVKKYREEVSSDVWSALARRLLPQNVADELNAVLKYPVARLNTVYHLTLYKPDNRDDRVVLKRVITYKLQSTHKRKIKHKVSNKVTNVYEDGRVMKDGEEFALPRHTRFRVGAKSADKNDRHIEMDVEIPAGRTVDVEIHCEELCPLSHSTTTTHLAPGSGTIISISNESPDLIRVEGVLLLSPNADELVRTGTTYSYYGGLLPAQGFTVAWKPVEKGRKAARLKEETNSAKD